MTPLPKPVERTIVDAVVPGIDEMKYPPLIPLPKTVPEKGKECYLRRVTK
jgi:hypothetical protein